MPDTVQVETIRDAIRSNIGGCREWVDSKNNCCFAPAEYVLWGKLIPTSALGPRCYGHAAKHVGDRALSPLSDYALINVGVLALAVAEAVESAAIAAEEAKAHD